MTTFIVLATVVVGLGTTLMGAECVEPHLGRLWRFLGIADDRSGL